jgi:hypothetical protein
MLAWRRAHTIGGLALVRLLVGESCWRGSTQGQIFVQGFLLQGFKEQGRKLSVGLSNKGEGCTMLGRIHLLGLV